MARSYHARVSEVGVDGMRGEGEPWRIALGGSMTGTRALTASDLERILKIYLRLVQELPPDTPAGHLDDNGQVHFAADIGMKLRTSREALETLQRLRKSPPD
jgi:hypothetical protein